MSSLPEKFLDVLPKPFLIAIILGGLVINFTSPVGSIIQQWLTLSSIENTLAERIFNSTLFLGSSFVTGIAVLLLETPILGDKGFYSKLTAHFGKSKKNSKTKDTEKDDFKFISRVGFYGWLDKNGCSRFLDQLNLHNSIVNALIAGFTISALLNVVSLIYIPIAGAINYVTWIQFDWNRQITITILTIFTLIGLLLYNSKSWKPTRKIKLREIGEEYKNARDEKNLKPCIKLADQEANEKK